MNHCVFVAYSPKQWYKFKNMGENLIKILIMLFIYTYFTTYLFYTYYTLYNIVNLKLRTYSICYTLL